MGTATTSQVIGRYEVYAKIAAGGMATVHFGRLLGAAGFARTVAIKRLHPHLAEESEFRGTLIDEARLAARIHHPNVVPTIDVVDSNGELLIVMEYVRGESLARLLRATLQREARVPLAVASAVVTGALQGLHAAHEAASDQGTPLGIVHRDVSPQNILVGVDGQARVIDFGVAKAAGRIQTTGEGVIKGKVAYMAPEQLCSGDVTRQVDVYAMAVVLWEVLTCKRLFHGSDEASLLGRILAGAKEPPSLHSPDLPPELDALVLRGLSREASKRFATAREMAEVLARIVPPALPTEVGAWVEAIAEEGLAQRRTALAEIESRSSGVILASPASTSAEPPAAMVALPTPPVETSSPDLVGGAKSRRPILAAAAAIAVLVVAVAALAWLVGRRGSPSAGSDRASATRAPSASAVFPGAPGAQAAAPPMIDASSGPPGSAVVLPSPPVEVATSASASAVRLPRASTRAPSTQRSKVAPPSHASAKPAGDPLAP